MVDFFEEVEEDLRAQSLQKLRKYLPYAAGGIGAVFAVWLGFVGWQNYAQQSVDQASIAYAKGLRALQNGDKAGADKAFADAEKPLAPGYRALALMQRAGIATAQNRTADAVKDLDAAAGAVADNPVMSDLARLEAAELLIDTAPYADVEARLQPLMATGRPFLAQATEALALAQVKANRLKDAKANFNKLRGGAGLILGAPQDVQERSDLAVQAIDAGDIPHVLEIAKAAATVRPQTPPNLTPSAASPVAQAGAAEQ